MRDRCKRHLWAAGILLMLSGFEHGSNAYADPTVLAEVGGRRITRDDFEEFKVSVLRMAGEATQTDSALLRSHVDRTVLLMEAENLGIHEEPWLGKRLATFRSVQIMRLYTNLEINQKTTITKEELLEHYRATERDRAVRVSGILVPTRQVALEIYEELENGADFARLAREWSVYETRDQGGDTGIYFRKDNTDENLKDHIFKLGVGEVSEPLPFYGKYALIKNLDEVPVPLSEVAAVVSGEVLERKRRERTEALVDSLMEAYAVEIVRSNVEELTEAIGKAGTDPSEFAEKVLCTYDGGQITGADFFAFVPDVKSAADKVDSLLRSRAVPTRLFLVEGRRRGLHNDPGIEAKVATERNDVLVTRLRKREVKDQIPETTYAEARAFYDEHPEKFQTIDNIVVTEILVTTKQQAEKLRKQIDEGADPAELAAIYTIREGMAHHDGRLELNPYKGLLLPGLYEVAKTMEVGEVAGPVKVEGGYTILAVVYREPPETKPFNKSSLRRATAYVNIGKSGRAFVEYVRGLRRKYGVKVFRENL